MLTSLVGEDVYFEAYDRTVSIPPPNGLLFVYICFWIVMLPVVLMVAGQVTKYVDDPSIKFAKWLEGKAIEDERGDNAPLIPMQMMQ